MSLAFAADGVFCSKSTNRSLRWKAELPRKDYMRPITPFLLVGMMFSACSSRSPQKPLVESARKTVMTQASSDPSKIPATKIADFSGDRFRAGDCQSNQVIVTIRSDGTGHLGSVSWTSSTHSGDYWWWEVDGYDARNLKLWTVPSHRGPRMNDGSPPPTYANDFDFTYPAGQFDPTTSITLFYSC